MAQAPFDPETAGLEDNYNPAVTNAVTADEPASKEEEDRLGAGMIAIQEYLYSESGMANVVTMLNSGQDELFMKIPKIVVPLLQKVHTENPDIGSPEFFGENGLIQQAVQMVFEIAEQEEMPGSDSDDQAAASLINTFRMVGEHMEESGDKISKDEAQKLGSEMVRTQPDGEVMEEDQYRDEMHNPKNINKSQRGLLA